MPYEGPGRYRHYKGGEYEVLGLAVRESTKPEGDANWDGVITDVIYKPLSPGSILPGPQGQTLWSRELEDFNAMVAPDDGDVGMFVALAKATLQNTKPPLPVPRFKLLEAAK